MARYNLTESQKDILRTIVENIEAGKLEEPLIPVSSMTGDSIIGLDQHLGSNLTGNLEALCDLDLMAYRYNTQGNKIFTVKQAGYDAVKSDFVLPEPSHQAQVNIGAIIHQMEGGSLQAIGFADHAEVQQIVNDSALLERKLEELTNSLLEAVKSDLAADVLVPYARSIEELREEVLSSRPSPSKVKQLLRTLAFVGDVEGTISLAARVWPFIYPILAIVAEKIAGAG